eukprot:5995629-Prymnesium_polylepis.1
MGQACSLGSFAPERCAAGRFGASPGQTSRDCTGPCVEGHYCEEGSTSNTSDACREAGRIEFSMPAIIEHPDSPHSASPPILTSCGTARRPRLDGVYAGSPA